MTGCPGSGSSQAVQVLPYRGVLGGRSPPSLSQGLKAYRNSSAPGSVFCPVLEASEASGPLGSYTLTDNVGQRSDKFSDLSKLLSVIRKDKRLRQYYHISRSFVDYLRAMDSMGLCISGFNNRDNKGIDKYFIANHRWTTGYRKKLLAKLYLLDEYIKQNPSAVTLLTLTVYQDGDYSEEMTGKKHTIQESFELLKKSWKKLSMMIRNILPGTEYIWIVEPHKSGYPHLHVVLFSDVSVGIQERIKTLWSEKYQAGSLDHGAQFEIRRPDQAIESLRNYLMKYIAKGFISTDSRYGGDGWTASELVFNACVWEGGYRTFQPSRGLQKTIGWTPGKDDAIYWFSNTAKYEDEGGETHRVLIWEKSLLGWIPGREIIPYIGESLVQSALVKRNFDMNYDNTLKKWIIEDSPDLPGPDRPDLPFPDLPIPPGPDLPEPYDPWWDNEEEGD